MGHAALQGDDNRKAGRDGPQDLHVAAPAASRPHQYRSHARSPLSRRRSSGDELVFGCPRGGAGGGARASCREIAVIGGSEIYAQWCDVADRLEVTEVHARPEGDTYFAAIDPAKWQELARVQNPAGPDDSAPFSYVTYRRQQQH